MADRWYKLLFDNISDGVFVCGGADENGAPAAVIDANEAVGNLLGYSRAELLDLKPSGIFAPETVAEITGLMDKSLPENRPPWDGVCIGKDLRRIPVEIRNRLFDSNGRKYVLFMLRDIDGRRKAQEALRESEGRFRQLAEASVEGIFIHEKGVIREVNLAAMRIFGYGYDEYLGKSIFDFIEPESAEIARQNLQALSDKPLKIRGKRKDGRILIVETVGKNISWNGRPARVVAFNDITYRSRVEEALQDSERKYRYLVENMNDVIYSTDAEGKLTYVNPTVETMLGYEPAELIGKSIFDAVCKDDLSRIRNQFQKVAAGDLNPSEYRVMKKSGDICWVRSSSRPIYSDGRFTGLHGVMNDITERIKATEELRRMEGKYRDIVENAIEGIFQSTPDGRFISVNPALARICGYDSPAEMMTCINDIGTQMYADSARRDNFMRLLEVGGNILDYEVELIRKDGSRIWVSFNARLVRDQEGKLLYYEGIMEDISKRKKAENDLRNTSEQLRALASHLQNVREEERIEIAREIHDQFGQSMTGINIDLSWLNKILKGYRDLPGEVWRRMDSLFELTNEVIQLTRDLSARLRPSILDDFGIVPTLSWQAKTFEAKTRISCSFSTGKEEISFSPALSTALFRICQECLINVARHSEATTVEIFLDVRDNAAVMSVADNGRGIRDEEISGAASFGLLGMKERVAMLRGEILFESLPGQGTTVKVTVPLAGKLS